MAACSLKSCCRREIAVGQDRLRVALKRKDRRALGTRVPVSWFEMGLNIVERKYSLTNGGEDVPRSGLEVASIF
jgi:hypothetical protein